MPDELYTVSIKIEIEIKIEDLTHCQSIPRASQ